MAGIPLHTSAPINTNAEDPLDDYTQSKSHSTTTQRSDTTSAITNQQPSQARTSAATGILEPATKTVPAPPLPQQLYPPPPQPSQLPSQQTGAMIQGHSSTQPVRQDLSHPPGYQQQQASFQDRQVVEDQNTTLLSSLPVPRGSSLLDSGTEADSLGEQSPIWDTAKSWAKAAGSKLSTTEAQVWKMVNGEK